MMFHSSFISSLSVLRLNFGSPSSCKSLQPWPLCPGSRSVLLPAAERCREGSGARLRVNAPCPWPLSQHRGSLPPKVLPAPHLCPSCPPAMGLRDPGREKAWKSPLLLPFTTHRPGAAADAGPRGSVMAQCTDTERFHPKQRLFHNQIAYVSSLIKSKLNSYLQGCHEK